MKFVKTKILAIVILSLFVIILLISFTFLFSGYKYKKLALSYAKDYGVSGELVLAIIKTESGYNKNALSNKGAVGLMQVLPSTADYIAKKLDYIEDFDLYSPDINVKFGTYYLAYLLDKFKSEDVAICAYNAGEGTVLKWGLTEDFSVEKIKYLETLKYYKKVKFYKNLYGIINYEY